MNAFLIRSAIYFFLLCTGSLDAKPKETLVIGMELFYPPFETIDVYGKPSGVSVDLAKALAQFLGKQLKIESLPFVALLPSLASGKIDLVLSSVSVTQERAAQVLFSNPYLEIGLALLIGIDSSVSSIEDLDTPSRRVVVKLGTTGALWAKEHLKSASLRVLDQEATCVLEVAQGKADAFIYDQLSILRAWQRNPSTTKANLSPFQKEKWAIAAKMGQTQLIGEVNRFLQVFRAQNGFSKLADTHLAPEKKEFEKMGVPFVF